MPKRKTIITILTEPVDLKKSDTHKIYIVQVAASKLHPNNYIIMKETTSNSIVQCTDKNTLLQFGFKLKLLLNLMPGSIR